MSALKRLLTVVRELSETKALGATSLSIIDEAKIQDATSTTEDFSDLLLGESCR